MIKQALFPLLLCAALPAHAQAPAPTAQSAALDPAALSLARSIVLKIAPEGTYSKMMKGPMDQMMNGMAGQMLNVPIKQFLSGTKVSQEEIAKLNNVTARDVMTILDPAFEQRTHIAMTTVMGAMGDLLGKFEPQLREAMAEAYVHNFSVQQLTEIDHFYSTPTGTAYAARLMTLMNDPSVQASMKNLMPEIARSMPAVAQKVEAATAGLPKQKTYADLTAADRARLAKLLGVDPAELEKAKTQ